MVSRLKGLPLKISWDRTWTKNANIETTNPSIPWNNFILEKNPMAESGI